MTLEILTAVALIGAIWSVLCRLGHMHPGVTQPLVVVQHLILGFALGCALLLSAQVGKFCLASGVALYLLVGAARWRYAAPTGTESLRSDFDDSPISSELP